MRIIQTVERKASLGVGVLLPNPQPHFFHVCSDIQNNSCHEIKQYWKAYSQKRRINKK